MDELIPRPRKVPRASVSNRLLRQVYRLDANLRDGSYWLRWLSARFGGVAIAGICGTLIVASVAFAGTLSAVALRGSRDVHVGALLCSLFAWFLAYKMVVGLVPFALDSLGMAAGRDLELLEPDRAPIHDARLRIVRVHGRRAGVVEIVVDTSSIPPGAQVEVAVALEEESVGGPLLADHPTFRGPKGIFVARELSAPVGEDDSLEMTMAVVFPVRALVIPKDASRLGGRGTIQLAVRDQPAGSFEFEWEFAVVEEDRGSMAVRRAPVVAAGPHEVAVVAQETLGAGICMVCGDELAEEDAAVACDVCETPHHEECWDYVGKCTTYACGGSAAPARVRRPMGAPGDFA